MRASSAPGFPLLSRLAALPGRFVPYAVQRPLLAAVLNEAFREPLKFGELDFLAGSAIRIRVQDLAIDWLLSVRDGRFTPLDRAMQEDVCISGDSLGFALLATRRADPDTLFFQRRIRVEGDTELGLGVKNTMDSMDWGDLPAPLRRLLQTLGRVLERLERRFPARFLGG
jgi:predicted lipid carrier protein YhbT